MKNPKLLFALIVFLLAYGVLLTLYSIGIERRLSRLESSYKDLEWRYRIDSNTLAHVRMTPELIKSLEAALVDDVYCTIQASEVEDRISYRSWNIGIRRQKKHDTDGILSQDILKGFRFRFHMVEARCFMNILLFTRRFRWV